MMVGADGIDALSRFYYYLTALANHQMLHLHACSSADGKSLAVLEPISPYYKQVRAHVGPERLYRLSRFSYLRRTDAGGVVLESPLSHALIRLRSKESGNLIQRMGEGAVSPGDLSETTSIPLEDCLALTQLLVMGSFVGEVCDDGTIAEERNPSLMQWDFHDLLFHCRSRMGRHNNPVGGRYRFLGKLPPQPVVKQDTHGQWVLPLLKPDLDQIHATDLGLEATMSRRTSIRRLDAPPITLGELGEFLFRVARVKSRFVINDMGVTTAFRLPTDGACTGFSIC